MISRTISVAAARLPAWLDGFTDRHGPGAARRDGDEFVFTAADGAIAVVGPPPFAAALPGPDHDHDPRRTLLDHVATPRTVGALLVRRNGYAVGIFDGNTLIGSKVGSRYVQGKTKAGGWSQQRFARRRGNQAQALYDEAADQADRLLINRLTELDAVASGGDRAGVETVLDDHRLTGLRELVMPRLFPVPDPRLAVLKELPRAYTAVPIGLNELA